MLLLHQILLCQSVCDFPTTYIMLCNHLQAYTKCMPTVNSHSVHVKSIVNTDFADRPDG